ncbi:hypothetical protein DFJ74DRAFT_91538 [Hyaloraphidium curvatum]|nr:hypothetical protein DFJ74DRAFT_91538 [Hyaloraphidium curvatum]
MASVFLVKNVREGALVVAWEALPNVLEVCQSSQFAAFDLRLPTHVSSPRAFSRGIALCPSFLLGKTPGVNRTGSRVHQGPADHQSPSLEATAPRTRARPAPQDPQAMTRRGLAALAVALAVLVLSATCAVSAAPAVSVNGVPDDASSSADGTKHDLDKRQWTGFGGVQRCIQSCSDGGSYFIGMMNPSTSAVYCAGSQGACAWYSDASCSVPKPLSVSPYGDPVPCPMYPSGGWCKAAVDVLRNGAPLPSCGGGGGGGGGACSANCPCTPVSYPHLGVDMAPYYSCVAPTNGPSYPGGPWFCLQDASGKDSWVPVKKTGAGQIGCMSTNSWDCIWTPRDCCLRLAATGTDRSPYFEVGLGELGSDAAC